MHKIKQAVNRVLALFPMEPPIYQAAGVPVSYVGHPLAENAHRPRPPGRACAEHPLPRQAPVFTLMPGSRQGRSGRDGPAVHRRRPHRQRSARCAIFGAVGHPPDLDRFEQLLWRLKAHQLPIRRLFGHAQHAMAAADAVLVASGTAHWKWPWPNGRW